MKLTRKVIKKLNKLLEPILKPTYFVEIPLDNIFNKLEENGILVIQEDKTPWSGFLCGSKGHVYFDLVDIRSNDIIVDSCLSLSWYKMDSGRYEVISYLT
jgi:hypothetical protein